MNRFLHCPLFGALALLLCAFASTASAQIDYGAYNIIVRNDATFNSGAHIHAAAYIGGSLSATHAEVSFGQDGHNQSLALIALGNVASNSILSLSSSKYYLPSETVASIKNNTTISDATLADGTTLKSADNAAPTVSAGAANAGLIFAKLTQESNRLAALAPSTLSNGVNPGDQNNAPDSNASTLDFIKNSDKVIIQVITGQLNILDLTTASLSNVSEIQFRGFDANTKLVINYSANSWTTPLTFNFKTLGLNGSYSDQVLWNISGVQNLTIGNNSDTFHGSILATQTNITWNANDMDGQLIASSLIDNVQQQFHNYSYFAGDLPPIPEPSTYALFGAASCGALALLRRRRR